MPDTVLRLQISCFECSSALEKISISNNCRFIDQYVFSGTALKSIYIPASVEVLKSGSFGLECQVETITVDPANPVYYVVDGVLYGHYDAKSPNVDSCHEPGAWLVKYPAGLEAAAFTIPEGIIGIEQHAFDYCANLTEIILPDSLRTISAGAFWGCTKLSKMELPENLERIYDGAFVECAGLVDLVVPASVDLLGYYLFSLHNLENLVFLGDAPEMTEQTFSLQTIKIYYPAGNTTWDAVIQMYAHESGVQWIECCETHQFVEKTREATCTLTGYTGRQCSVCGLVEVTGELIPAKGHDLELFYKDTPSCEFSSWEQYQCKICQEQVSVSVSEATGHNYVDGVCVNCVANEAQDPTDPPDIQEPNEEPNIQDPTGEPDIQEPTEEPDVQDSTYPPEVTDQTQVMLLIGLLLIGGAFVVIPVMLRKKK